MKFDILLSCIIKSDDSGPCMICGEPTSYAEVNYEGWICSTECLEKIDRQFFAALFDEGLLFEEQDKDAQRST
jgi:hypothetical protein